MAEKMPASTDEDDAKPFWKKKTVLCMGALLSLGIVVLGGWLFRSFVAPPPPPPPPERNVVGFVNLQEASKVHKDFPKLQQLREECALLREEIADLLPLPQVKPPEVEAKPFEDSVWQKIAQEIIGKRAEIERQQKKSAEEYRANTEAQYLRQRDEIDASYLQAITNLRMKLENADVLHLSEEMVQSLSNEMAMLQRERGARQKELWEQREEEIEQHARESVAESLEELNAQALSAREQFRAEALKKQSDAQARDVRAMEQQMESVQRFQKAIQKRQDLMEKEQECLALENHIFNDVAGKAAKLAILHHFMMIVANPATRLEALIPWDRWVGAAPERYSSVVASGAEDITEELIKELDMAK